MILKAANRWQAFGLHLLISLVLFLLLSAIIYFWWYPGFLFLYDGGLEGMKLIAGVDFFIGPLLTLLVYKVGKKTLRFDLACIAVLQLACLSGGMWTVWQTRPVAVVYAAGSFGVTNERGYKAEGYDANKLELLKTRWPVWLSVKLPEGAEQGISQVWAIMGSNLQYSVENYAPYSDAIAGLEKAALAASELSAAALKWQTERGAANSAVRFFPATTSMYTGQLAVDTKTGKALAFFPDE